MKARLVKYVGKELDLDYPVPPPRCTVGRDMANAVQLADPKVSKQHAVLTYEYPAWSIEDLKSRNGTLLNGEPVQKAKLEYGDRLTFGDTTLHFEFVEEGEAWVPSILIDGSHIATDVTMRDAGRPKKE
jgi:pSer/pThr/pTyr-binding forkhead associated (FHA) protein